MAQFIKTIQNFASQNKLWEKKAKLVVGVSGGSDSVCLLAVLNKLSPKYEFELHIAHVNYGLRGEESKKDELFVRELAQKYALPISVLSPQKTHYKGNLEESLRKIRYDFFEKLRVKLGYDLVVVAHNQDDQAETVLMRILRGSSLSGLGAMKAKTENIIRPLLQTTKKEILAYLKAEKLLFRTDKSNLDLMFTRNKIRHDLLPYLEKNFNPKIKQTLSELASSVAEDYDFIHQNAQFFATVACKNKCVDFQADDFLALPIAIQRQVLRNFATKLKKESAGLEYRQIEELLKVIKSDKSKQQKALIGGLNISKKGAKVHISC